MMQSLTIPTAKKKVFRKKFRETLGAMGFFGPGFFILVFVMLVPIGMVIYYSFFDNMIMENTPFVGFKNYQRFFNDSGLFKMVRFTIVFTIGSIISHFVIGLSLALALNRGIANFALGIFRAIFILPWIFTAAVVAIAWQLILLPQGILNSTISSIIGQRFLFDYIGPYPVSAMLTLVGVNAWRGYPFFFNSFLAGLQNIPDYLYEAASIDGANNRQLFFHITLPQLKPVILSVILLDTIWTLNLFPLIWLLTGGGPLGYTDTIATFVYRYAFIDFQFGRASAAAVVGLAVTMIFTFFYVRRQRMEV